MCVCVAALPAVHLSCTSNLGERTVPLPPRSAKVASTLSSSVSGTLYAKPHCAATARTNAIENCCFCSFKSMTSALLPLMRMGVSDLSFHVEEVLNAWRRHTKGLTCCHQHGFKWIGFPFLVGPLCLHQDNVPMLYPQQHWPWSRRLRRAFMIIQKKDGPN